MYTRTLNVHGSRPHVQLETIRPWTEVRQTRQQGSRHDPNGSKERQGLGRGVALRQSKLNPARPVHGGPHGTTVGVNEGGQATRQVQRTAGIIPWHENAPKSVGCAPVARTSLGTLGILSVSSCPMSSFGRPAIGKSVAESVPAWPPSPYRQGSTVSQFGALLSEVLIFARPCWLL